MSRLAVQISYRLARHLSDAFTRRCIGTEGFVEGRTSLSVSDPIPKADIICRRSWMQIFAITSKLVSARKRMLRSRIVKARECHEQAGRGYHCRDPAERGCQALLRRRRRHPQSDRSLARTERDRVGVGPT